MQCLVGWNGMPSILFTGGRSLHYMLRTRSLARGAENSTYIWSTLLEEVIDQSDIDQSQDGVFEIESDDDDGTERNSESDSNSKMDEDEECFEEDLQDYDSNSGDEESNDQLDRDLDSTLPEEKCK